MNLSELHAQVLVEGDPVRTAEAMAAALRLSKVQREALWPLIEQHCWTNDRNRVRRAEKRSFGRPVDRSERARLLSDTFPLPDGRRVSWGEATIEDHQLRIGWLAGLRDGINETIARHDHAIEQILAAGVTCLTEVEQVAA